MKHRLKDPQVFYGLHFAPGVCHYTAQDLPGVGPFTILINSDVAKEMDPTMAGKAVFVIHKENEQAEIQAGNEDGWVSESFFNQADGFHWAKFLCITEEGLAAIRRGWTLSNAYEPQVKDEQGDWHAMPYQKVALNGKYKHLAIVPNPRYQESKILTPAEFKAYNDGCEQQLLALRNSKSEGETSMFDFFKSKKEAVKIDADLSVTLPNSKKVVNVHELLKNTDEEMTKNPDGYAHPDHKVKLHDGRVCNVGQLLQLHHAYHQMMENEGFQEKREAMEAEVLNDAQGGEKGTGHEPPKPEAKPTEKEVGEDIHNETPEEKAEREKKEAEDKDKKQKVENARRDAREKAAQLRNASPKNQEKYDLGTVENAAVTGDQQLAAGKKLF
ncbi:MAG TPA: DUF2213 domain-containing protein [Candidatus Sulfotelmatobacter sp.]|nr:DUF2213 domain-containing protein [Candidatus Sulfotelmatobacter sp.]